MPMRPPKKLSWHLTMVGILAALLALASGWYVAALGWSVLFLLGDGWLMAIYSVVLLVSPALFTMVAIAAFLGRRRTAGWFLIPLAVKWLAAFAYSFVQGGWEALWSNLPVVTAITRLGDEFMVQYRPEQLVMLIAQFDVEPIVLVVMVVLLAGGRR
jgi:hypothetical protein